MNYELRNLSENSAVLSERGYPSEGDPDRSRLLLEFNNAVVSQLDLEDLLKSIFDCVRQVFQQTSAATLAIYDSEQNELRIHLLHSDDPDLFREGMPIAFEGTPSGVAFFSPGSAD